MWNQKERMPLWEYLGWTFLIAGLSYSFIIWGSNSEIFTSNILKIFIMLVDTLIGTFSPMHAVYIVLRRHGKISGPKELIKRIIYVSNIKRAIGVTLLFCVLLLIVTMFIGTRTDSPWFMFILAIPIMVLAGGVEEVGWRGFLQPALEERLPFIVATLVTAGFWMLWHLPLWLIDASSQARFAFEPYLLNLIADSFILATIYILTKSIVPCIFYHAWGNAIGAIYEWNIFATLPINIILLIYYCIMISVAIVIRVIINRRTESRIQQIKTCHRM